MLVGGRAGTTSTQGTTKTAGFGDIKLAKLGRTASCHTSRHVLESRDAGHQDPSALFLSRTGTLSEIPTPSLASNAFCDFSANPGSVPMAIPDLVHFGCLFVRSDTFHNQLIGQSRVSTRSNRNRCSLVQTRWPLKKQILDVCPPALMGENCLFQFFFFQPKPNTRTNSTACIIRQVIKTYIT